MKIVNSYIDGSDYTGASERRSDIVNPANAQVEGQVNHASAEDLGLAVESAQRAYHSWSQSSPVNRARVLFRFRDLVLRDMDQLAHLLSAEHGKTFTDAKGDIQRGLDVVEFACGIPHLLKGETTDMGSSGIDIRSLRTPLGVVAGITPFNFPAMIPMWMFAVAVACGNTFILKPSEKDPSVPLALAKLLTEAGAPKGVLNVVQGDKVAVDAILNHPKIKAVSFVGSTAIAQYVYATGTANGKRVQAMGGAKNHAVILPDADINFVADALIGAAYGSAGERCMALPVAVPVGEQTAEALIEALIPRVKALRIGHPDADLDLGPLVSAEHRAKVAGYIQQGIDEGATAVINGLESSLPLECSRGFYMAGTLFDHVTPEMTIYLEEIFGPVLCIVRAQSYQEALSLASEHQYGNGVALFTKDGRAARDFAAKVEIGMVGINVPIPVPLAFHTFGGWKASAFGDINQHGPEGVRFFTKTKTITSRWPEDDSAGAEFSIPVHN